MLKQMIKSKSFFNSSRRFFSNNEEKIKIDLPRWQTIDLEVKLISSTTTTTKSEVMKYFYDLSLMRRMEVECDNLYKQKEIRGFCHLYLGQESIAVGMESAITKEDCIITAYREHCNHMARGDTPYRIIAEMMSRASGSTQGKGGSMHYYSRKNNFYGGNGIVGAQIPVGTGLAFALKYENKPNACFTMFGDGTCNQGQLFEASNMAGLWKLPVVYVIENNRYGMGTSVGRASFHQPLSGKFRGFPALLIDGMNVFAVREAVKFCKDYVIKNGPMFLEIDTYRYHGHSMSDPGSTYRNKEEVAQVRKDRDCIETLKSFILKHNVTTENELKDIEKQIRNKIEEDIEKIKADPLPESSQLYTHLYTDQTPFVRGVEYNQSIFNEHKI